MVDNPIPVESNIALLSELLTCGTDIHLWQYQTNGELIHTTSKHLVLDKIFESCGAKDTVLTHAQTQRMPLVLGGGLGLVWCAVFQPGFDGCSSIYVLGPVFNTEISTKIVEKSIRDYNISPTWRKEYIELITRLPVVSSILFFQYALMLHYCVTGEKITRSDVQYSTSRTPASSSSFSEEDSTVQVDRMQVYLAERGVLNMVREGDLNYRKALERASYLSNGVQSGVKNPLLHAIVSCTSFTSLCVREAIQAGISPETAYSVGDGYIKSMLEATEPTELISINHTMYEDFIMRVHKHRTNPLVSPYIQVCRDYIEMHTEDELSLTILAQKVGYSEYHLSRKFKQEMGMSISAYIKLARVERAKFLLVSSPDSISQVAAALHFCSSSHFSNAFLELTGKKPQQYRKEHGWRNS